MDRTHPCGGCNVGSIPAESTANNTKAPLRGFCVRKADFLLRNSTCDAGFHASRRVLLDDAALQRLIDRLVGVRDRAGILRFQNILNRVTHRLRAAQVEYASAFCDAGGFLC